MDAFPSTMFGSHAQSDINSLFELFDKEILRNGNRIDLPALCDPSRPRLLAALRART